MEKWFVYAGNEQSIHTVRSAIGEWGDRVVSRQMVRDFSGHNNMLELFEISREAAELLDGSARSGSNPLVFRFFRQRNLNELPTEVKIKKDTPKKITAMKQAIRARVKRDQQHA